MQFFGENGDFWEKMEILWGKGTFLGKWNYLGKMENFVKNGKFCGKSKTLRKMDILGNIKSFGEMENFRQNIFFLGGGWIVWEIMQMLSQMTFLGENKISTPTDTSLENGNFVFCNSPGK